MVAWLITWKWATKKKEDVALILNYRTSVSRIIEITELLYVSKFLSDKEKMAYAKSPKNIPYPAEFFQADPIKGNLIGNIICGHNPFLCARIVDDLIIDNITNKISWKERKLTPQIRERIIKQKENI